MTKKSNFVAHVLHGRQQQRETIERLVAKVRELERRIAALEAQQRA